MLALPDDFAYSYHVRGKSNVTGQLFGGKLYYGVLVENRIRCACANDGGTRINAFVTGDYVAQEIDVVMGWDGDKVFGQLAGGTASYSASAVCPPRYQCDTGDSRFRSIIDSEIYQLELIDYSTGTVMWAASLNNLQTNSNIPVITFPAVQTITGTVGTSIDPVIIMATAENSNPVTLALDSHYTIPDGLTLSLTGGEVFLTGSPTTAGNSIAIITATAYGCETNRVVLVFNISA